MICIFRARLRLDGHSEELAPIQAVVEVYSAIRSCYATIRKLFFWGCEDENFKQSANRAVMTAHAIKRKTVSAKLNWDKTLELAGASDMKDMIDILQEMNKIKLGEDKMDSAKSAATAVKLTTEGG